MYIVNSKLPSEIQDILQEAHLAVMAHPAHLLEYQYRVKLWKRLGPRRSPGQQPSLGHTIRARIAAACARRSLPLWKVERPQDQLVFEAIRMVDNALENWGMPEPYFEIIEQCIVAAESVMRTNFVAYQAGKAAACALMVAVGDEQFDYSGDEENELDAQSGGPAEDAAGYSAVALSGGTSLNPHADPSARFHFWEWYLNEAVPDALIRAQA